MLGLIRLVKEMLAPVKDSHALIDFRSRKVFQVYFLSLLNMLLFLVTRLSKFYDIFCLTMLSILNPHFS